MSIYCLITENMINFDFVFAKAITEPLRYNAVSLLIIDVDVVDVAE